MSLRAVILDFDGVIVESNDLKTEAFARVFARFPQHAAAMMAFHHAHVSDTRFLKFKHLAHNLLGLPEGDPLVGELAEQFSGVVQELLRACSLVPGASAFLDTTVARVPLYLASVTPQQELDALLAHRGFAHYFTRAYGCPPWTKATAVADVLRTLGGAQDVLFIGDSAGDQRAALANGVEFIARDSGLTFDEPRPRAFPDMTAMAAAIAHRLPAKD